MKEEEMNRVATLSTEARPETTRAPAQPELVSLPVEAVARLERLATGSLLSTGLAHEIANPLSCLNAAVTALDGRLRELRSRGGATAAEIDELASDLELAQVGTEEMGTLVRDFQMFLRPGDLATAVPIDLKPAVLRALRLARSRLAATAPVSVALGEAPAVRIPSGRVTQIVLNLLFNAADALAGRPWSANLVEVRLETIGGWAVIDVKDNGPGLDPETRKHLFAPGITGKRQGTSLGLGLAICRELARASGGDVTTSTPLSPGTLFRVVLPPAALG
jgi:two-component system sensor histidine kinase AauS